MFTLKKNLTVIVSKHNYIWSQKGWSEVQMVPVIGFCILVVEPNDVNPLTLYV